MLVLRVDANREDKNLCLYYIDYDEIELKIK